MGWYIVRGCLYGSGRDVAYFRDLGEFERHSDVIMGEWNGTLTSSWANGREGGARGPAAAAQCTGVNNCTTKWQMNCRN